MRTVEVLVALAIWLLVIPIAVFTVAGALYAWEQFQLRRTDGSGDRYAS